MDKPISFYRELLEANVVTGFNLVRMTQKCDGLFNEYTIFEKTKRMIALGLLTNADGSIRHTLREFTESDFYESCFNSFNDYIENSNNDSKYFNIYDEDATFTSVYGNFENIFELIEKEIEKIISMDPTKDHDYFLDRDMLLLCLLIINAVEFNYPDELEFYYDASFETDVEVNQVEDYQLEKDGHQEYVGV